MWWRRPSPPAAVLTQGWELAPLTNRHTYASPVDAPTTGEWQVQYKMTQDAAEVWTYFDEIFQWRGGKTYTYGDGGDVVLSTPLQASRQLSYRVYAQDDGSALSWFQLNGTTGGSEPIGSMLFTAPGTASMCSAGTRLPAGGNPADRAQRVVNLRSDSDGVNGTRREILTLTKTI